MPTSNCTIVSPGPITLPETPKPGRPSTELRTGDRVTHSQFGDGIVVSCKDVSDDHEVVVAFDGQGVKRLLMSFAHLEKVG